MTTQTIPLGIATNATATGIERRETPRYSLLQRCLVRPLGSPRVGSWRCIAHNISATGIGITMPCPLEKETLLEIEAWGLPRAPLIRARIVHSTPVSFIWSCGCRLVDPLREEDLQEWLKGPLDWLPKDNSTLLG